MDTFPDPVGAYVPHGRVRRPPNHPGGLSGLTVAVKDLFDWAGVPTGAGVPDWLTTHLVPERDAAALTLLLDHGATLHGKTVTDELAYSIHGDNVHYGTPQNAADPGRVPGGSSSGSAAAVAAGLVDAALGTDTGGSIRVPAAYCGLWGLRTTHGTVPREGLVALSRSFDTVGWLARTADPLARLAEVLLPGQIPTLNCTRLLIWSEALALADDEGARRCRRFVGATGLPVDDLGDLALPFGGLAGLRATYATIQGFEAWAEHGPWITACRPQLGPAVAQRFVVASRITEAQAAEARQTQAEFRERLIARISGALLVLPSTVGPAPVVDLPAAEVDLLRERTMRLTAPAGLAGLPQLTWPYRGDDGLPRGLGLVGPAHSDRGIVAWAQAQGAR